MVLTRNEVIDVRAFVTVAEITTSQRGLATEVALDSADAGVGRESAVNCDGIHTVPQTMLTEQIGAVNSATMHRVCQTLAYAVGC
jgi:mRNA-degrading endonuclease toxin of MazEF toxin-antitoxin module